LPLCHAVQRDQGHLSNEAMEWIAQKLEVSPMKVYEVVTFYPYFRQNPIGKHHLRLCRTLSCALCGSYAAMDKLKETFGCEPGEVSPDGTATFEFAECLASCHTGPVMLVDDELIEHIDDAKIEQIAEKLRNGEPVRAAEFNTKTQEMLKSEV
jgi:NADH-quinone oxidoreductase subunit E